MFIDRWVRRLLPRRDNFFELLEGLAGKIVEAAGVFGELGAAAGHDQFKAIAERLKKTETEADDLCHQVYEELDRTFVTPIDREDLARLTHALDDVIDGMEHSAAFAALFRFNALPEPLRHMVRITTQAAGPLAQAVGSLRQGSSPDSLREPTLAIHTLENEGDAVYRSAMADLFSNGAEGRELIRQMEMLFSMEEGVDVCEDAMDIIYSVVVKNG